MKSTFEKRTLFIVPYKNIGYNKNICSHYIQSMLVYASKETIHNFHVVKALTIGVIGRDHEWMF